MSELSLSECYQLLGLEPGATVEEIEAAYLNRVVRKLREGVRQDKALLKTAYTTLKAHTLLEARAPTVAPRAVDPQQRIAELLERRLKAKKMQPRIRLQGEQLRVWFDAQQTPQANVATAWVYVALIELELPEVRSVKVYGVRGNKSLVWKKQFQMPQRGSAAATVDLLSFKSPLNNAIAFPASILLALVINSTLFLKILFLPFQIWIHEFGHATVAWLSGRHATPLPFGWTNIGLERSLFVYFGVLTLLGLLFWSGWCEGKSWSMVLAVSLAVLQFLMTWNLSEDAFQMWCSFGGIGGEFYLSTLLMVSFYFRLPERWRWDFWRYILMLVAASTFWDSFWYWHRITRGEASIPWGSLFGGEGDAGGDMNRLSWEFGWSDAQIIETYSQLGNVCAIALFAVYLYFLIAQNGPLLFALQQRVIFGWTSLPLKER